VNALIVIEKFTISCTITWQFWHQN